MLFVEKTGSEDPAHRYRVCFLSLQWFASMTLFQIIGQWFVPMSTHPPVKRKAPEHFVFSIHEPSTLAESHLMWNTNAYNVLPAVLSGSGSALLAKLAVPILRHLTETVSHIDAMQMWSYDMWLSRPDPLIQPEEMVVLPEEIARSVWGS